jgi:3-hydroxyisobutyrate dehydrogenase
MVGVSEAMNLGIKFGIDPKVLAGAINSSSGRCWSSDTYNPVPGVMENVPASRGYSGGFGSSLMKKDLWLALQAAQETKAPLPLASAAHQLYALMTSDPSAPEKDFSSVFEFLQGHK